jgi:hypothetical protein
MSKSKLKIYTFKSLIPKDNYELDILIAYCNLIFAHVVKFYKRQFYSRQPLYNKIVVEFKKQLNVFYAENKSQLPLYIFLLIN